MNLFFYDVDANYVKYLKAAETAKRGFSRVPDIIYQNERKMVCGVVLEINECQYYVPISSYKKKQPNNILIYLEDDHFNQIKGSLRFNFMFPVLVNASCDFKLLEYAAKNYKPAIQNYSKRHKYFLFTFQIFLSKIILR
jgi:protein AbiQ